jgi:hypothetical protein
LFILIGVPSPPPPPSHQSTANCQDKKDQPEQSFSFATRFVALAGNLAVPKILNKKQGDQMPACGPQRTTLASTQLLLLRKAAPEASYLIILVD